jgi:hypothetical protein
MILFLKMFDFSKVNKSQNLTFEMKNESKNKLEVISCFVEPSFPCNKSSLKINV